MEIRFDPNPLPVIAGTGGNCEECGEDSFQNPNNLSAGVQERVSLSGAGNTGSNETNTAESGSGPGNPGNDSAGAGGVPGPGQELTPEEQQQVQELKETDRKVRAHEAAHKSAAGAFAKGGPSFTYTTGPDGERYAVGGEVQIDTAPVPDNPQATIRKARTIRRAATAPADPSTQDRQVAAQASAMEAQARRELAQTRAEQGNAVTTQTTAAESGPGASAGSRPETDRDTALRSRAIQEFTRESTPPAGSLLDLFS